MSVSVEPDLLLHDLPVFFPCLFPVIDHGSRCLSHPVEGVIVTRRFLETNGQFTSYNQPDRWQRGFRTAVELFFKKYRWMARQWLRCMSMAGNQCVQRLSLLRNACGEDGSQIKNENETKRSSMGRARRVTMNEKNGLG